MILIGHAALDFPSSVSVWMTWLIWTSVILVVVERIVYLFQEIQNGVSVLMIVASLLTAVMVILRIVSDLVILNVCGLMIFFG